MPSKPLGPPLLGARLRMPLDVIRERMLEALHDRGFADLVPAHLIVLRYPGPDGHRPSEIAARSGMSKQAINYLLGELERLGYLERRPDGDDHRAKRVYLTERGITAGKTMRAAVSGVEREFAREHGEDALAQLLALLSQLGSTLGADGSRKPA